jgi:hypothetical protein
MRSHMYDSGGGKTHALDTYLQLIVADDHHIKARVVEIVQFALGGLSCLANGKHFQTIIQPFVQFY